MKISNQIYLGPSINEKMKRKYIKKLNKKKRVTGIYILICRLNNSNLIEIISTGHLYHINKWEDEIYIFGITKSKEEAVEIIRQIVENTITHYEMINKKTLQLELNRDEKKII